MSRHANTPVSAYEFAAPKGWIAALLAAWAVFNAIQWRAPWDAPADHPNPHAV